MDTAKPTRNLPSRAHSTLHYALIIHQKPAVDLAWEKCCRAGAEAVLARPFRMRNLAWRRGGTGVSHASGGAPRLISVPHGASGLVKLHPCKRGTAGGCRGSPAAVQPWYAGRWCIPPAGVAHARKSKGLSAVGRSGPACWSQPASCRQLTGLTKVPFPLVHLPRSAQPASNTPDTLPRAPHSFFPSLPA